MAALPAYPYAAPPESSRDRLAGIVSDSRGDNRGRTRKIGPVEYRFRILWPMLTQSEAAALETFADDNAVAEFTFTWNDSVGYDVHFEPEAVQVWHYRGPTWQATAAFRGVKS